MDKETENKRLRDRAAKSRKYLHSPSHLLADELSKKFGDTKHFGLYLKLAVTVDHEVLRRIMGEVLEKSDVTTPGKLFSYLVKEYNKQSKSEKNTSSQ